MYPQVLAICFRSSSGPTVLRHLYILSKISSPSTTQPPGKRKKEGWQSFKTLTMRGESLPFRYLSGSPHTLDGRSETQSTPRCPLPLKMMTSRPICVSSALTAQETFAHSPPLPESSISATVVSTERAPRMNISALPANPSFFTHMLKLYVSPLSSAIP